MWDLMGVEEKTGITLTDSLAMIPAASVSGLYFANPESSYFSVGKIATDQLEDYAARKKMDIQEIVRVMPQTCEYCDVA